MISNFRKSNFDWLNFSNRTILIEPCKKKEYISRDLANDTWACDNELCVELALAFTLVPNVIRSVGLWSFSIFFYWFWVSSPTEWYSTKAQNILRYSGWSVLRTCLWMLMSVLHKNVLFCFLFFFFVYLLLVIVRILFISFREPLEK